MLIRCRKAFCLALFLTLSVAPAAPAQEVAQPLGKPELQDGDCIVFLGDSITHQCLYTQYVEDYFYTRFPKMRLKLHNAGVGGAQAWDALQRFDEDVAAFHPKYVTILLGMNDGHYQPYDDATFQTYRQDMTELITQLQGIGATPIPMTPTMFDARARRMNPRGNPNEESTTLYNSVLAYYGTWLRDAAQEQGFGFVDMWSPLNNITLEQRKTDPKFTLIADAVHPGADGQVVMATAIINDLGLERQVSNIQVFQQPNGKAKSRVAGGTLSDLTFDDDGVSFTWQADSLPWVLPDDAQLGVKLTKLGHRLSGERLGVQGLAQGKYKLLIDGSEIGEFPASAFARRIELQANAATPQYQQALEVANLNKQRNEGPVRSLRGEWSQFQRFARARRHAQEHPDDAEAAKQLTEVEAKIEGMTDRAAQHIAAAQEIEDRIFEINQPPARKYEIRPVR
ncbi:MAG: SGNH/GDSL hydrolase family protein [Planctomycetaceae bacterium]